MNRIKQYQKIITWSALGILVIIHRFFRPYVVEYIDMICIAEMLLLALSLMAEAAKYRLRRAR